MIVRDTIVLLEYAELVNDSCITVAMYKHGVADGKVTVVQKGGGGHPALIDWASLPEKYKALVRASVGGDPAELAKVNTIERHMELRQDDEKHIDTFRATNGRMLTNEKRDSLKKSARVLALLAKLDEVRRTAGSEGSVQVFGMPVLAMKEAIIRYVKLQRLDLPGSFARLEARKRDYLAARARGEAGMAGLIHGGHGNKNSSKLVDPYQIGVLETLAGRHQNLTLVQIAEQYNTVAVMQDWPTITPNTVKNLLKGGSASRSVTFFAKGAAAYQEKHGIVIHRSRPSQPTYMWVHDSTVYELYYQKEKNGKVSNWERKWVCVVLDPHSWYPVGYSIGDVENIELTKAAVKNAVAHMKDLTGSYALPFQVQSDRGGHQALKTWYGPMGITYTPAKARNARAKVIEPYFKAHHRDCVQAYYPNYGGHNIDSLKKNQPNPDAQERLKHSFPNEASVIEQIHEAFARDRASKAEQFVGGLRSMDASKRRTIGREQYLEFFGTRHPWPNRLTNKGLCPTLLGVERPYNLLNRAFQECVNLEFSVTYDPADLNDVLATSDGGAHRYLVPSTVRIPMALQDHTPETRALLAHMEQFKKELGQEALDRYESNADRAQRVAGVLLEASKLKVKLAEPKERRTVGPAEEAAVRSYAVEQGSHKVALAKAQETDEERRERITRAAREDL